MTDKETPFSPPDDLELIAVRGGPDLTFQRKLTAWFMAFYFVLIISFCAGVYLLVTIATFEPEPPDWVLPLLAWMQGILATLIGTKVSEFKAQMQFWFGSSVGSKSKDKQAGRPAGD